jgi:hypothetical protein
MAVKPLLAWQGFMGFNDQEASEHLALSLGEYRRQLATRPTRQTARLCVLLAVYHPNLGAITSAAANLHRLPARPEETTPADELTSQWS